MQNSQAFLQQATEHFSHVIDTIPSLVDDHFDTTVRLIQQTTGHLICSGMGKSGLIAGKLAATFASTGTPAFFLHPAEALHGDLGMITKEDTVLMISNSGETAELSAILPSIQTFGNPIIALTSQANSTLAKAAKVVLSTHIDRELCPHNLAPTTSTLLTLAIGDLLAVRLMHLNQFAELDFARFHPGGSLGRRLLMLVKDGMRSAPLPTVDEQTLVKDALVVMSEGRLGLVLVIHNDQLAGVFTDGDLRRALVKDAQALDKPCGEFMSRQPQIIHQHAPIIAAEQQLMENKIKVLLVSEQPITPSSTLSIKQEQIVGVFEKLA